MKIISWVHFHSSNVQACVRNNTTSQFYQPICIGVNNRHFTQIAPPYVTWTNKLWRLRLPSWMGLFTRSLALLLKASCVSFKYPIPISVALILCILLSVQFNENTVYQIAPCFRGTRQLQNWMIDEQWVFVLQHVVLRNLFHLNVYTCRQWCFLWVWNGGKDIKNWNLNMNAILSDSIELSLKYQRVISRFLRMSLVYSRGAFWCFVVFSPVKYVD